MDILEKCPLYQNKHIIKRILDKTNYNIMTYNEIFIDDTRKVKKIKKGDYLASGRYPIIDQGQEYVGGYADEDEGIYNDIPFIIFGDHTRIIKYIEKSSFIGADGVKVLNIKDNMVGNIDIRYIYYYLLYSSIPNDGYSRHFKYVKNLLYVIPPIEIQKQIVEVLDEAQKLINNRKEQLKLLDYLIKSIFYDMFGDPVNNEKNWQVKQLNEILSGDMQNGLYKPHTDYTTETSKGTPIIRIDGFYYGKITEENHKRVLCSDKEIHKYNVNVGDILINRVNSLEYLGKSAHVTNITESTVFESNIMKFRVDTTIVDNLYFIYLLNTDFIKNQILGRAKKSVNQASINQKDVKSFLVTIPPIQLQNQFAEKVELIEKQKSLLEQSLKLLEDNYNNLMQKAFKGELF